MTASFHRLSHDGHRFSDLTTISKYFNLSPYGLSVVNENHSLSFETISLSFTKSSLVLPRSSAFRHRGRKFRSPLSFFGELRFCTTFFFFSFCKHNLLFCLLVRIWQIDVIVFFFSTSVLTSRASMKGVPLIHNY